MDSKNQKWNRRSFLTAGVGGIAAGGILTTLGPTEAVFAQEKPAAVPDPKPILRTLGKTGIKLPIVSMGVMNAELPELVKRSYDIGVRHFDTAAYYQNGRNEEMVGSVIKQLKVRDKVVIATKVFVPLNQRDTMKAGQYKSFFLKTAEESLKRLETDYLDILYIHNAQKPDDLKNPGTREALAQLKKQGKARFIGFSTHMNTTELVAAAAQDPFWDVILTTFNFGFGNDEKYLEALRSAAAAQIGLIAMKTQMMQEWYWKRLPEEMQRLYQGTHVHTAALKWVLQHPFITTAVPGYTTFEQMEQDWPVAHTLDFTPEEKQFLADRNVKLARGYCRQCSTCVAQCPQRTDIPTLMRVHMYATCYRNFQHARQTLEDIPEGRSYAACAACSSCPVQCPHGVDVAGRIKDLAVIYG